MKLNKILFILFTLFSIALFANENKSSFDSANNAYSKGEYEKAIKLYSSILSDKNGSAEVYFNIGNSYFKSGKLGLAILNFERAKKISPNDDDINSNLKFANLKTEDKIEEAPQLFLTEWKNGIIEIMTEKSWSITCILTFIIAFLFLGIYFVVEKKWLKKFSFYLGALLFLSTFLLFFIAKHKNELELNSTDAIIVSPSVTITGSPSEKGTKLFLLHEGTKVVIMDESPEWTEIKIANGNTGWIKTAAIQKI